MPAFDSGALNAAGKRVVVIGGGDTAMDCVRTAVRQGAISVRCLYRRDRANMPGSMREVRHAEEEGVEFVWQAAPEAFLGDGEVSGRARRAHAPGRARRHRPAAAGARAGSSFAVEADLVIKALGFDPEDLPTLFGQPELAGHPLGHGADRLADHDDGDARRVRRRRHRARRIAGGLGRARRARRRGGHPRLSRGQDAGSGAGLLRRATVVDTSSWADRWVADYRRNAAHLAAHGLYDPSLEHGACGVGFVAAIDGKPRREVVRGGHRCPARGLAPRRGRRRRQDR